MTAYYLRPKAVDDLEDIWVYTFKEWSRSQADSYQNDIIQTIKKLTSGELKGRVSDIKKGYLTYLVGSHIIFYRSADSIIEVVRILHQSRDFGQHV